MGRRKYDLPSLNIEQGNAIRSALRNKELTQDKLGKLTELPSYKISKILRGKQQITPGEAKAVYDAIDDPSLSFLLENEISKVPKSTIDYWIQLYEKDEQIVREIYVKTSSHAIKGKILEDLEQLIQNYQV